MRSIVLAFIIIGLLTTGGWAASLGWTTYRDQDFNCVLDYPSELFRQKSVPVGKPKLFANSSGDIYFRI